eukprot:gene2958-3408_t
MEGEIASTPTAGYVPEKADANSNAQKKTIVQSITGNFGTYWTKLLNFKTNQTATTYSPKKFFSPFKQYLKKPGIFVTKASQESTEKKSFEAVTDTDKPYIRCMMGGSMIGIPYAFKQAGFPIGIILVTIFAFLIDYCTMLLIQNSILAQETSYKGIVKQAFGKVASIIVSLMQLLFYLSVMSTYHVLLGDIFPKIVNRILQACNVDVLRIGRRFPIVLISLIMLLPLCLLRDIRTLSKFSLVSVFCITTLTVFSLTRLTTIGPHVPYTHNPFRFSNMNVFQAVGVIAFVFLSQHSSYFLYGSVTESTASRFTKASYANISYSLLMTLSLGVIGYMTFKGLVQGDFLENYCEEDDIANMIKSFIFILVITMYPLDCHGAKETLCSLVLPGGEQTLTLHIAMTTALVAIACTISMFIDCLSLILEISGLLLANPLVTIIPCGTFLRLTKEPVFSLKKLPCLVIASAGFVVALVGIVMVIFMPHRCIHTTKYLPYCNGSNEILGPLITLMALNESAELDPLLTYNVTEYGYDNITDIAAAYFT